MWSKIWIIAGTEFGATLRTKGFLIALAIWPILMGGSIAFRKLSEGQKDTRPKRFAVIDEGGAFYPLLEKAAEERTAALTALGEEAPPFVPEPPPSDSGDPEELRLALSEQ